MKDIAIILGIRPDVIRASKILKLLNTQNDMIDKLENMVKSLQESLEPKVN